MTGKINILDYIEESKRVHSKLYNDLNKLKFTTELVCKQYLEANKLIIDEFNSLFKGKTKIQDSDFLYDDILENHPVYRMIEESINNIDISNDNIRYSELEFLKDIDIKSIKISQSTESWYITISINNLYLMLNKLVEQKYDFRFLTSNFQDKEEISFRFSTHHHLEDGIITFKGIDVSVLFKSSNEDFLGKKIGYNIYQYKKENLLFNKESLIEHSQMNEGDDITIINQMKAIFSKKRKQWSKKEFRYMFNNFKILYKKEQFHTNKFLITIQKQLEDIKKEYEKRFAEKLV